MQSIFTYDPDPPRVSSPWRDGGIGENRSRDRSRGRSSELEKIVDMVEGIHFENTDETGLDKLDAEPQEGPTEYKVHLLLRPRRTLFTTGNARHVAGSQHARSPSLPPQSVADHVTANSSPLSHSSTTRQHRLEQLTTQLLWRLQQSSPLHTASASNIILPSLPDASGDLLEPQPPAQLLPGLEESNGALYEIGVSDDGAFVGLTKDEMHESLNNLQAMAASLGCITEVLRMVRIGTAECVDKTDVADAKQRPGRQENLYVAEAYVKPLLEKREGSMSTGERQPQSGGGTTNSNELTASRAVQSSVSQPVREQLRVTLAGATTSGKSSLLGTLSMSTLDNGHGKSRLSLLKHRHELASGMTSSVAQELIGYRDETNETDDLERHVVVNYASSNISSWNDLHAASSHGRLAFISDSAGHPRYRRTTVRGLLGCAPHWTMLCIPASDKVDTSQRDLSLSADGGSSMFAGASAHISMAQLDLCLRLRLPLVVVVTKLDTASKMAFRQILSTLLSTLKSAERKPVMLANDSGPVSQVGLQSLSSTDMTEVMRVINIIAEEGPSVVPIVFTSAVNGTGIGKIHALLRHLPLHTNSIRNERNPTEQSSGTVFHVDEVFKLSFGKVPRSDEYFGSTGQGSIVSGHLARGEITVGQELLLGPFSSLIDRSQDETEDNSLNNPENSFLTPRSFTDALAKATATPLSTGSGEGEWQRVRIVSARNLRLPVQTLYVDCVGTLGIVPLDGPADGSRLVIRRGMVLINTRYDATHTLTASFDISDASSLVVGNRVVIYTASVRSSAKVVAVALKNEQDTTDFDRLWQSGSTDEELAFAMDDEDSIPATSSNDISESILVTLQLDSYREWIEVGSKLLVMPGGGPGLHSGDRGIRGLAGLEGFVGRVVETFG